jgi:integrase
MRHGRRIVMTRRLTRELIAWWRAHPRLNLDGWLVVDAKTGKRHNDRGWWSEACARAELSDVRFHDTRHIFATNVVEQGGTYKQVAALLGVKSVATAEKYAHRSYEAAARAFRLLDID